ncbi:uncharacterized protein LOC135075021 [Ostrinia nubilalis]|uniref:uncharacterized protein LOC135075021 n=1 Tax=Ostrinia nubilalis TaxID=29057 RepID=UPI0030822589
MPRQRTLRSIFIDMVVFVGMFALLGHLSINFWERFVIQSELSNMKTSLHSLKETINRIGYAYDNLHRELLGLAEIAEKKQSKESPDPPEAPIEHKPETPQKIPDCWD